MNKLVKRVDRLIKRTHRFVPREKFEAIVEAARYQLETVDKRGDLKMRVQEIEQLLIKFAEDRAPETLERIRSIFLEDAEAHFTHVVRTWESRASSSDLGFWYRKEMAEQILEIANRSQEVIDQSDREKVVIQS